MFQSCKEPLFWCSSLKSAAVLMWCDQCDLLWAAPQQSSAGRNTLRSGPDNHMLSGRRVVWVSPVKQISWHVTQPSEGEEGEMNSVMRCVSFTAFYSGLQLSHHGEETSFVQCRNLFSPLNTLYGDLQIYASSGNCSVKHKKMFSRIVTPIPLPFVQVLHEMSDQTDQSYSWVRCIKYNNPEHTNSIWQTIREFNS